MRIAIFGATGYGGTEAMRLLATRTDVKVAWVGSDSKAGDRVASALPQFRGTSIGPLPFSPLQEAENLADIDVALLAMPHGQAQAYAPMLLRQGIRVIDFSGDYRLPADVYETWYKRRSSADQPAVYGLPEVYREEIAGAKLIANPGCYATCAALALLPLVEEGYVDVARLLVDAKSGVSGAGKSPTPTTHFVEVGESLKAYKVGAHQHTPEMEQVLADAARRKASSDGQNTIARPQPKILMTTQLLPIKRGIYVTAYAELTKRASADDVQELFANRFADEPFVDVLPLGQSPEIRYVTGTNRCQIGVHVDERTNTVLIMSTLDNLVKGAAGQAIQNMNLMFGLDETAGLLEGPWF